MKENRFLSLRVGLPEIGLTALTSNFDSRTSSIEGPPKKHRRAISLRHIVA